MANVYRLSEARSPMFIHCLRSTVCTANSPASTGSHRSIYAMLITMSLSSQRTDGRPHLSPNMAYLNGSECRSGLSTPRPHSREPWLIYLETLTMSLCISTIYWSSQRLRACTSSIYRSYSADCLITIYELDRINASSLCKSSNISDLSCPNPESNLIQNILIRSCRCQDPMTRKLCSARSVWSSGSIDIYRDYRIICGHSLPWSKRE